MHKKLLVLFCALFLLPSVSWGGRIFCGKQEVPRGTRSCPDGGIPMYVADETKPYTSKDVRSETSQQVKPSAAPEAKQPAAEAFPQPDARQGKTGRSDISAYFGVWRTRIPGAVWTSPSGYQGYDWLHVSAGVSVGDLIIRPDGTYLWNSYGGKKGKWVRGDESYPVVLIDTVENRRWKVAFDPRHTGGRDIVIWDGNAFYYDGRR